MVQIETSEADLEAIFDECILEVENLGASIEFFPWERKKTYVVQKAFTVKTSQGNVTIPQGFTHDRFSFAPDLKSAIVGAIVHDWLYETHEFDGGIPCTKKQADQVLKELIFELGKKAKKPKRYWLYSRVYWLGVKFGGGGAWKKGGNDHEV